jgi:hypothetical protein
MRPTRLLAALTLFAMAIALGMPGGWAAPAQAADIEQMIVSAKTPADHEAIAAYYDQQAKEARDKAELHRKMGQDYKKAGGALAHKTHFHEHCEALTAGYERAAKDFAALAAAHREMVKASK